MQGNPGRRRLNPQAEDDWSTTTRVRAARRDSGVQQTRRISSWTAAALVAGVAASAGYFAHAVSTPTVPGGGAAVTGTVGAAHAPGQKPSLTHPVVTSGGSGVVAGTAGGTGGRGGAVHWGDN